MSPANKKMILIICTLLQFSCSKSVFTFADSDGTSKFILYKNSYSYFENSRFGKFSEWGTYEVTDSLISFVYRNKEKIPYTYKSSNIEIRNKRANEVYQIIYITDQDSKSPIPFVPITIKDQLGNIITGTNSDFDGKAVVNDNKEIYKIEIVYDGYAKQEYFYNEFRNYDLTIQLEAIKQGGRMTTECLSHPIDIILEYKIDNPSKITKLERNGSVYTIQNNRR